GAAGAVAVAFRPAPVGVAGGSGGPAGARADAVVRGHDVRYGPPDALLPVALALERADEHALQAGHVGVEPVDLLGVVRVEDVVVEHTAAPVHLEHDGAGHHVDGVD